LAIDRSTVAKWESGESMPRAQLLPLLAEVVENALSTNFSRPEEGGPDEN